MSRIELLPETGTDSHSVIEKVLRQQIFNRRSQNGVRQRQQIKIARLEKKVSAGRSENQAEKAQYRIRQMGNREHSADSQSGGPDFHKHLLQAVGKISVKNQLLYKCPTDVTLGLNENFFPEIFPFGKSGIQNQSHAEDCQQGN